MTRRALSRAVAKATTVVVLIAACSNPGDPSSARSKVIGVWDAVTVNGKALPGFASGDSTSGWYVESASLDLRADETWSGGCTARDYNPTHPVTGTYGADGTWTVSDSVIHLTRAPSTGGGSVDATFARDTIWWVSCGGNFVLVRHH